jgi:hypothetical protein
MLNYINNQNFKNLSTREKVILHNLKQLWSRSEFLSEPQKKFLRSFNVKTLTHLEWIPQTQCTNCGSKGKCKCGAKRTIMYKENGQIKMFPLHISFDLLDTKTFNRLVRLNVDTPLRDVKVQTEKSKYEKTLQFEYDVKISEQERRKIENYENELLLENMKQHQVTQ